MKSCGTMLGAAAAIFAAAFALPALHAQQPTQPPVVVIEEGTGNWCGYCPDGTRRLESIKEEHGKSVILIAYHGGSTSEPMRTTEGQAILGKLGLKGYPNAALNRVLFDGQDQIMISRSMWAAYTADLLMERETAPIRIDMTRLLYTEDGMVSGTVRFTAMERIPIEAGSSFAFNVITTEDSVLSDQTEYTSSGTVKHPVWQNMHVARGIYPNADGSPVTFPGNGTEIKPGDVVTADFSFPARVKRPELSHLVLMLHTKNGNALGRIIHAQEFELNMPASSVEGSAPAALSIANVFPNPAAGAATVMYNTASAGRVSVELYSALGERVAVAQDTYREAGSHVTALDVAGLPSGRYTVRLTSAGSTVARTISVVR